MLMEVDMQTKQSIVLKVLNQPWEEQADSQGWLKEYLSHSGGRNGKEIIFCYQIRGEIALYSSLLQMVKNDKNKTINTKLCIMYTL